MFVRTSPQRGLFETDALLSEKGRALLKRSWAESFARDVLPRLLVLEPQLEPLYSDTGRPNWSAARMLGLVLLRELLGLGSDREVVEALAFDARFHHALGLAPEEAYLSRRSLVEFRRRFQTRGPELAREIFDEVTAAAIEALDVRTSTQRIDSTFVTSNIALRGRAALLAEALEKLLDALGTERRVRVQDEILAWYGDQDGWDSRVSFEQVARWLHRVLREFRNDEDVTSMASYDLALDLLSQHVTLIERGRPPSDDDDDDDGPDDDPPATPSAPKKKKNTKQRSRSKTKAQHAARRKQRMKASIESTDQDVDVVASKETDIDRIQSVHDQDARFGLKGTGYHAQFAETCGNTDVELITDVAVTPANTSDMTMLTGIVESLTNHGRKPEVLLADAGYTSGDNLVHCEDRDIELVGPVRRARVERALDRNDFQYDEAGALIACPEGHTPTQLVTIRTSSHPEPQPHAHFDHATCEACPKRAQCPVADFRGRRMRVSYGRSVRVRDERLREQRTTEFRERYAPRSGIEASNSELKRAHALGRLPVRGADKVYVRVVLKAAACNIKRWHRASQLQAAA
jgi:hypothetical protein